MKYSKWFQPKVVLENATQLEVYDKIGKKMVEEFFKLGINGTVLAYGQSVLK